MGLASGVGFEEEYGKGSIVKRTVFCAVFIAALVSGRGVGALELPSIFGDHMVLQQNAEVAFWGRADFGEAVTVGLGGVEAGTSADAEGRWKLTLRSPAAGGPYEVVIAGESETVTLRDVLVGEVWLCGGETNMEWPVSSSADAEREVADAAHPRLRLFRVKYATADEPQWDCTGEWQVCSGETVQPFSAAAYYFGRALQAELDVPVGLIQSTWSGAPAEAWTSLETLRGEEVAGPLLARWDQYVRDYPEAQVEYKEAWRLYQAQRKAAARMRTGIAAGPVMPVSPRDPGRPATLYNAMLMPLAGFTIRGAILYQGEKNVERAYQYRSLFRAMIRDWRRAWGGGAFPVLFVQLANYGERRERPRESAWAELREAQSMALELENTAMAVAIDLGDAEELRPPNKQEVGRRLSLAALGLAYGKEIPFSGPLYASMAVEGREVRLKFSHAHEGLVAREGRLTGFSVAGEDQEFVWADARIEGEEVVVGSAEVRKPVAVRYGWARNPECNLFNGAGLPASPFRTDSWYGLTISAR